MGSLDNIGGTLLDVQRGMEYAKENQRRDALFDQTKLDNSRKNTAADIGLSDYVQSAGDRQAQREAAAGKPSVADAATAATGASLARGDVAGATQASKGKLDALVNDYKTTEQQFSNDLLPVIQGMQRTQTEGAAARQPGIETLQDQDVKDKISAGRERLIAQAYRVALVDKDSAVKLLSDSPVLFHGQKVSDIMVSKDGTRVAVVGEDGQPLIQMQKGYLDQLAEKYSDPGKIETVKPGESLVRTGPGNRATEVFSKAPADTYAPIPENSPGVFDKRDGTMKTGGAGLSSLSSHRQDQRFKIAEQVIGSALGGSFDQLGKLSLKPGTEQAYQRAFVLAEQAIKNGADPGQAANAAINQAQREAAIAKAGGTAPAAAPGAAPGTPPAATGTDWKSFVPPAF